MIEIQEFNDYDGFFVKCPCCAKNIGREFDGESTYGDFQICDNLLFIGTDVGFEICDKRVKTNLGEKAEGLKASTFHTWCMSLIRRSPDLFGCKDYSVIDREDQLSIFKTKSFW